MRTHTFVNCISIFILTSINNFFEKLLERSVTSFIYQSIIQEYICIRLLLKQSDWFVPAWVEKYLGNAFVVFLVVNCFMILGSKIFPIKIYVIVLPTAFLVIFFLKCCFKILVAIHENTKCCIKYKWPIKICDRRGRENGALFSIKYTRKVLLAQKPVSFKCGDKLIVDSECKLSYYTYIIKYSNECLLLFKSQLT